MGGEKKPPFLLTIRPFYAKMLTRYNIKNGKEI